MPCSPSTQVNKTSRVLSILARWTECNTGASWSHQGRLTRCFVSSMLHIAMYRLSQICWPFGAEKVAIDVTTRHCRLTSSFGKSTTRFPSCVLPGVKTPVYWIILLALNVIDASAWLFWPVTVTIDANDCRLLWLSSCLVTLKETENAIQMTSMWNFWTSSTMWWITYAQSSSRHSWDTLSCQAACVEECNSNQTEWDSGQLPVSDCLQQGWRTKSSLFSSQEQRRANTLFLSVCLNYKMIHWKPI